MSLTREQIEEAAHSIGVEYAAIRAFISIESGGEGFKDGKLVIQFEPTWFHKFLIQFKVPHTFSTTINASGKKTYTIAVGNKTIINGVEGQLTEWRTFNIAFSIHPKAAMLSTSIGMMQVMGFNYDTMGYHSVDEMWDDFKKGEYQQLIGATKFIADNVKLHNALIRKDWSKVAYYYNGEGYKINKYDEKLANKYTYYLSN